jgi:hypothetical protein
MSELRNLLEEDHRKMACWFLWHQECLLLQEDDFARFAFDEFSALLSQHIAFENGVILPAVENAGGAMQWKPELYRVEHEKIERLRQNLKTGLEQLFLLRGKSRRLQLLQFLQEEQTLQRVLDHHEQREEKDLFLFLQTVDLAMVEPWQQAGREREARIARRREELARMLE